MGERESLYGGLDRSTVDAAQSVLQLQKLLQRREEKNSNLACENCIPGHRWKQSVGQMGNEDGWMNEGVTQTS